MMTRSAGRSTVAPRGGRTGGRVGRGARRTRPTVRKNNETIGKLDGQGNDRGSTSNTIKVKPSERPELEKKPYPSSLSEKMSTSVIQQMARSQKRSFDKQNLNTNYRGKHKSRDVKELKQKNRVLRRTMIGMVRGDTSKKRPRERSEQWASNEISFPSMQRCQFVDSPIILEALIEGFQIRRIYVDGGSSSEVMYEQCF
ncbi:hypothetical protein Tco_1100569 [Tanacetum coccineum]